MPRSIRPGCRASSRANCSATTSGAWLGSITPPEPILIRSVRAARCAMSTGGLVLATAGMLWCSATQSREYPRRSAARATSVVAARASAEDWPEPTVASSSTDRGRGVYSDIVRHNVPTPRVASRPRRAGLLRDVGAVCDPQAVVGVEPLDDRPQRLPQGARLLVGQRAEHRLADGVHVPGCHLADDVPAGVGEHSQRAP